MFCPRCGRDNQQTAKYCNECGFALQEIHTILQKRQGSNDIPAVEIAGVALTSRDFGVPEKKEDLKKQYVRTTTVLPDGFEGIPRKSGIPPQPLSQPVGGTDSVSEQLSLPLSQGALPESLHAMIPGRIRNPSVAVALSLIPGLGQVYNGKLVRGIILFAATLLGMIFFIVPGFCIWIYSIYDAYRTAEKINRGEIAFRP